MTTEILVRYLHFISMFVVAAALVAEHLLLKKQMTRTEIARMATIDSIYGLSALTLVGAGLSLWFWVGKPADFYTHNWVFHLKLGLVILFAILSIPPTVFFLRNRKKRNNTDDIIPIPKYVILLIRLELLLLFLIPLCAVFMAKGIGYVPRI